MASQLYNLLKTKGKSYTTDDHMQIQDAREILESSPSLFWISKHTIDKWEVRAKGNVKLCLKYQRSCDIGHSCGMLHLCKDFLNHQKACTPHNCKNGFSNNMNDKHNKRVLSHAGIDNINILRSSFPRLCKDFLHRKCSRYFCGYLHICPDYVLDRCSGKCEMEKKCNLENEYLHNFCNEHNKHVLANFNFHYSPSNKQLLLANVLIECKEGKVIDNVATEVSSKCSSMSKEHPLLPQVKEGQLIVLLCKYYLEGKCQKKNCPRLHFCKDFLISDKKCNDNHCKYGLSHDPLDENNRKIMAKRDVDHFPSQQLIEILRRSFPRICKFYHEKDGLCEKRNCNRIHICQDLITGQCNGKNCSKSHNIKDTHNLHVLKLFSLDKIRGDDRISQDAFLWSNILISKKFEVQIVERMSTSISRNKRSSLQTQKTWKSEANLDSGDINIKRVFSYLTEAKRLDSLCADMPLRRLQSSYLNENVKTSLDDVTSRRFPSSYSNETVKTSLDADFPEILQPVRASCSSYADVTSGRFQSPYSSETIKTSLDVPSPKHLGPTEQDVIADMLEQGKTSLPLELLTYFDDKQHAEEWLVKRQDAFRLESTDDTKIIHICVEEIRPCPYYWSKRGNSGCSEASCGLFHVCYDFLFHERHNKRTCKFNHDLQDSHNQMVLSNLQFTRLTETHIMELLRVRYPFVCMDYNDCACLLIENSCTKLHICYDYLNGNCKKVESLCRFKHQSAFSSQKALDMMKDYHIEPKEFKFCIILPEKKHEINKMLVLSSSDTFNPWKDEAICLQYLAGECEDSSLCHLIHSPGKRPFLWQNKKANEDGWNNFSSELNEKMEEGFCDPSRDSWSSDLAISCESFATLSDINCNKYNDENVEIRRLSTKSSVKGQKDDYGLTEWQWYWKGNTEWHKYDNLTDKIELAFLNDESSFKFQNNTFNYVLSFDVMEQQNQNPRYLTKRAVRRRPVFKTKEDMKRPISVFQTPAHWPLNHGRGERISLDFEKYQQLIAEFQNSIEMPVMVWDIREICNKEHYDSYERKKMILQEKLNDVNEKLLYHGTDHFVVDAICAQNFDWRLCGRHATVYGKGSYFSTTASYSHRYTTSDGKGYRYMFLASILAGRSTVGNSRLVRPPEVDASTHDLYDSCVNSLRNPSIYVIFERDQCYPRYLITYEDTY